MTWREVLRDFLRGFSEADVNSLARKLDRAKGLKPGSVLYLTNAEAAAMGEHYRRRGLVHVVDA